MAGVQESKIEQGRSGHRPYGLGGAGQRSTSHLYKLWNRLTSGSYFPVPVKRVEISKKDGGVRKLGVPTLLDRIAQQVVRQHLERQLEPLFHESSFGYRPKRSAHQAVKQSERNCFGHDFVVDLDIKGFFDNINHDLMMKALTHYCKDGWNQLNPRLLKWIKWEKRLYKMAAVRWLKRQYKSSPGLFAHWKLVQPKVPSEDRAIYKHEEPCEVSVSSTACPVFSGVLPQSGTKLWEGGGELKIMNAFEKQWATVNKFPCLTRLAKIEDKPWKAIIYITTF
jgi:hypothetical protein